MSEKFQGKYRSESARLQNWDYSSNGAYFITICTHNREHFFGEIQNGKMELSRQGVIADLLWHEIKHHTKNVTLGEFIVMPNHIHGILILNDGNDDDRIGDDDHSVRYRTDVNRTDVIGGRDVACNVPTTNNVIATPTGIETATPIAPITPNAPDADGTDVTRNVPDTPIAPDADGTDVSRNVPVVHNVPNAPTKNEQMAAISPKAHTVSVIIRSYKSAVTKHCNRLGFTFAWQTRFHDHIIRNNESFNRISTYIQNNPANWKEDKFY